MKPFSVRAGLFLVCAFGILLASGCAAGKKPVGPAASATSHLPPPVQDAAPLIKAARKDDIQAAKEALAKGIPIEAKGPQGGTALFWAAYDGKLDMVKCLIGRGADPEREMVGRISPTLEIGSVLCAAAYSGSEPVVNYLIDEKKIPVDEVEFMDDGFRGGWTPFCYAAYGAHLSLMKDLLAKGADLHFKGPDGRTPLFAAIESHSDSLTAVRFLLNHGARVNAAQQNGWVPILDAASLGKPALVSLLLKAGADPNAATDRGDTPIMVSQWVAHPSDEVTLELLKAGATLVATDNEGERAESPALKAESPPAIKVRMNDGSSLLMSAAKNSKDNTAVLSFLLEKGAKLPEVNKNGKTAFDYAVMGSSLANMKYLVSKGADPKHLNRWGDTTLLEAASIQNCSTSVIHYLLSRGVDPYAANVFGFTALQSAALSGNGPVFKQLLSVWVSGKAFRESAGKPYSSPLQLKSRIGANLLWDAVISKHPSDDIIKKLVAMGCKEDVQAGKQQQNVLQEAASNGALSLASFKLLFERWRRDKSLPDPLQLRDGNKGTLLILAADNSRPNLGILRYLIHQGADVYAPNKWGNTALQIAVSLGNEAEFQLLMTAWKEGRESLEETGGSYIPPQKLLSSDGENLLMRAAFGDDPKLVMIKQLLDMGIKLTYRDKEGWTVLQAAAYSGHPALLKWLVAKWREIPGAADPLALRNKDRETLLHLVARAPHFSAPVMLYLIKMGIPVAARDHWGQTPLALTASYGNVKGAAILLAAGARIDALNADGETPLYEAVSAKKPSRAVVDLLLKHGADPAIKNNKGQSPLQLARRKGLGRIVSDMDAAAK
ncbi:MAG: ankyrin repeat domain-containing protein [Acidobacteriota bacterium]